MLEENAPAARRRFSNSNGFTLVELLVVIGIVAVLLSMLLPALSAAQARSRRIICLNRLGQLAKADLAYGIDHEGLLIPGTRDAGDTVEHCIWVSHEAYNAFVQYGGSDTLLGCPNLQDTGLPENPGNTSLGWVLGYNYLGGHARMLSDCGWRSPLHVQDPGTLPVACDLNDWAPGDGWTCVAHDSKGRGDVFVYDGGKTAVNYPSAGGHVAYLDGSVSWIPISEMTAYQDCTSGGQYYGMH